ncbi:hypothetical protein [Pseudarthrobacter sp. MEB009]|uniref:hypothetical protein n=1 Tax=Pseudarthrobacter sp. MEB009 TaxID=3040326 RepID=UPI0025564589|nr:hypothetical protein [Pseudarthrobacter sp. MEB009]
MAKFTINPNAMGEKVLEAETFSSVNGYWYFFDAAGITVYVASEKVVHAIERHAQS